MVEPTAHGDPPGGRAAPLPAADDVVDVELSLDAAGIARVTLRARRGLSLPLRLDTLNALERVVEEAERLATSGRARVVTLEAAVPRPTLPGYDLDELRTLRGERITAWSRAGQRVLRRLERLSVPSIAVIREAWLGGAAELALACSHRVASDTQQAVIGFPQTRLGFLPAWGGTVRLPRLVGLRAALDLVLGGEPLHADQAAAIGLVDQLLPGDDFEEALARYALRRGESGRPSRRPRRSLRSRVLDQTAPGRRVVVANAARHHLGATQGNLAARVALDLIRDTIDLPLEQAFARESAVAGELIPGAEARGRLHSERLAERMARRTPIGPAELQAAAVIGGGETGADLAHLLVAAGMAVRIKEDSRLAARDAVDRVRARIGWERERGRISEAQARRRSARIENVSGFGGFGTLDLVLVAAEGGGAFPADRVAEAEAHVRPACLIGVAAWGAPSGSLQRALQHPERLFGFQPALPVGRYPVVEIAPGSLTSADTIAAARRLARRLAMTSVVVADAASTPLTRLLAVYLAESLALVADGLDFATVDDALARFGFDLGPFQRIDAIGGARAARMLDALVPSLGPRVAPPPSLRQPMNAAVPFYHYRSGRPSGPNPELPDSFAPGSGDRDGGEEIARRVVLALIDEAARILEDGGVADPGDLDLLSTRGLGFPSEHGGLLFHASEIGIPRVVDELARLAAEVGDRFAPAGLLRDMAVSGATFFGSDTGRAPSGHPVDPVVE